MNDRTVDKVAIGTWVRVRGFEPGIDTTFHFVPHSEIDYLKHKVPESGLLGSALIGAEVGHTAVLDVPGESMKLTVLGLGRDW